MDDIRFQKVENSVQELSRKVGSHEELHSKDVVWKIDTTARLKQIDEHVVETNEKMTRMGLSIDAVRTAFPDNNFDAHRRYHQTMLDMLDERRKLRIAIQEKTISGLIWAGIVGIGIAVWHEILSLVRQ